MHTSETIHPDTSGGHRSSTSQPTRWSNTLRSASTRNEPLGRLHGTTLTERVIRFLEQYNGPVYSLG
jgi:hypothetical protein